jgi:Cu(I)/Ag(I) efflux system membrane fusion protein
MDLIPVESGGQDEGPRSLTLSPAAQKIAEIQTAPVVRQSVETTLRMVGKLEADETRVREISAWVPGRIDRLYIDYTGVPVRNGEKLFDLYSPELYSAQEELLQAIRAADQLSRSTLESTRRSATRTIDAVRERLRLWGLTTRQIEDIEKHGTPSDHVTIVAPMSGVVLHKDAVEGSYVQTGTHVYAIADLSVLWLKLDVYESDLAWVKLGQTVEFDTDTYPGETFQGTVAFIDPMLNERSRSVKVRVNVANPDSRLKPGMFARAVVHAAVEGEGQQLPLVIPASAPLVTGTRAVVYVQDPEQAGQFHGREVVLGPQAGKFFVVREGLEEGERVVSNGSFKIDSALQILAKPSMMNPEGGGPAPGHQHGSSPSGPAAVVEQQVQEITGVPEEFRIQLDDVIALYFKVSTALSHDHLDQAKAAAAKLPRALLAVDHSLLPHAGHGPWGKAQRDLESASEAIAAAADIKKARRAFYDLSVRMIDTVRAFRASGRTPVLVYHCPMARDGAGADWLQPTAGTENPYYGSQMFKCGSQTETLVAGPNADAGADHTNH